MLTVLRAMSQPQADEPPIYDGHRCSLFELTEEKCCRPVGNPGDANFSFCGILPKEASPTAPFTSGSLIGSQNSI